MPYIGEIRMFAGNFAPANWALCDGQLLAISDNDVLFQLIGTTYGGDGQTTFALPDLRGRLPVHLGSGPGLTPRTIGEAGGLEQTTLTVQQMPFHTHPLTVLSSPADRRSPKNAFFAATKDPLYAAPGAMLASDQRAIGAAGGSQPHTNVQPYLCINFIISLFGIFPTQN